VIDDLDELFRAQLGRAPQAAARAPGRVNWIGEHTDYNEGLVLPLAIDRSTWVAVAARDDGRLRAVSREQEGVRLCERGDPVRQGDWCDYARGAVAALEASGRRCPGADLAVQTQLPLGSGLSSSAALLVGLVTALDACFGWGMGAEERARVAHRAESEFVGVPCGVMDPFASALCPAGHALRIDCRSLEREPVPLLPAAVLLLAHSGVTRRLAAGGYGERRAECETALRLARRRGVLPAEARSLRDVEPEQLAALEGSLPDRLLRRVRHVVRENARVDASCVALRAGDAGRAGALLREGMESLRCDFEVSTPELDALCAFGDAAPGVFGSRLVGAGFGGCTLHLVAEDSVPHASRVIADGFERRFGRRPPLWSVRPGVPAEALRL
jgi:galactokinase